MRVCVGGRGYIGAGGKVAVCLRSYLRFGQSLVSVKGCRHDVCVCGGGG